MKFILFLLPFLPFVGLSQVPANDACASAITIATGGNANYNTTNATSTGLLANGEDIYKDVWYKFTAVNSGAHTVSNCGSSFDSKIAIYSAVICNTITNESHIAFNDDDLACVSNNSNSKAVFTATIGLTYFIRIGGATTTDFGAGVVTLVYSPPPVNDACTGALTVTVQPEAQPCTPITYTNVGATTELPNQFCVDTTVSSVWFSFTTSSTQTALQFYINNISTEFLLGDFFTNCAGTFATGLDQDCIFAFDADTFNIQGFAPSTTYYLRLGNILNYGGTLGSFEMCIKQYTPPPPPANDSCINAIAVFNNTTTSYNTESATTDLIQTATDSDYLYADVWYTFIAPFDTVFDVSTCGSDFDTKLAIYQANTCATIVDDSEIAYNDDDLSCVFNDVNSFVQFTGIAGTKYYIRVGGYEPSEKGDGVLTISGIEPGSNPGAGLKDISQLQFELYPNPANEKVTVAFATGASRTITVVDCTGKTMFSQHCENNSAELSIDALQAGLYLIKISSESGLSTQRLFKR